MLLHIKPCNKVFAFAKYFKLISFSSLANKPSKSSSAKPWLTVGTIGHVDHGKTTLTSAITKVLSKKGDVIFKRLSEIDKLPIEQSRGITINATCINYQTEFRNYTHVDCPGHADYMKNMIIGAVQMTGAVLVVAATDGCMPQTKEHVILAKQIGIKHIIVYINKVDCVDDKEIIELVELEVRQLLSDNGYSGDDVPVIKGSALTALEDSDCADKSIEQLLQALDIKIPQPERDIDRPFLYNIDKYAKIHGFGTIVMGYLERGRLDKGSKIQLVGRNVHMKGTVNNIERYKQGIVQGVAGDRLGLSLKGVPYSKLQRGMIIVPHNHPVQFSSLARAKIILLSKEDGGKETPVFKGFEPVLYIRSLAISAEFISLLINADNENGETMLMPGESCEVELQFRFKILLEEGLRFTIREKNSTIGSGIIIDII